MAKRLIFVSQDESDDDDSSQRTSSSGSSCGNGDDSSTDENDSHAAAHAAAIGHSPGSMARNIPLLVSLKCTKPTEGGSFQPSTSVGASFPESNSMELNTIGGSLRGTLSNENTPNVTGVSEKVDVKSTNLDTEEPTGLQKGSITAKGPNCEVSSSTQIDEYFLQRPNENTSSLLSNSPSTKNVEEPAEMKVSAGPTEASIDELRSETEQVINYTHENDDAKHSDRVSSDREKLQSSKKKNEKKKKATKPKEPTYYCPYDLNERDDDENTPIHVAIHACELDHVSLLLKAGASPHVKCDGSAPVHLAISLGAIPRHAVFAKDCVTLLREYGADLSSRDEALHTPLYLACMSGLSSIAALILSDAAGMQAVNAKADRIGGRALHAAGKYDFSKHGGDASRHHDQGSSGHHHHHQHRHHGSALHVGHHQHNSRVDSTINTINDRSINGSSDRLSNGTQATGAAVVTQLLLSMPGIEVDPPNNYGRTPLHIASMYGNWPVVRLLLQHGANAHMLDRRGYTPGQLSQKRGMVIPNDLLPLLGHTAGLPSSIQTPARDLIIDPDSKTLILCHELCSRHMSCPPITREDGCSDPPPENIRRLYVLLNEDAGILRCEEFSGCTWELEARRASMADVLKVHEYSYIETVSQLCASLPDHLKAIASLDADTSVSRWSFEAAMRAAGSVCEAVDRVMSGDVRNAFCAVRPPGHHAGPRGIVTCANDPDGSHGFCLLNNIAIGAAYARSMYRNDGIRKVAIIDFDVHHGNGTEAIIRQLIPNVERTTVRTPFASGTLHKATYMPWLDENDIHDVFFASTHGYGPRDLRFADHLNPAQGGWFYPASGKSRTTDAVFSPSRIENPNLTDFLSSQTWTRMGEDSRSNCCKIINVGLDLPRPQDVPGMQRVDLRDSYRKNILPHLLDFDPDMIFISAGFDAHKKDSMNFGYVGMVEDDYEWVTQQLVKVANTCCNGRIVSVLEGGYKIHGGIVSPFARSVASHVRALVDGGNSRELYDKQDGEWESQFERHLVEEKERRRQMKIERLNRPTETEMQQHQNFGQHHGSQGVGHRGQYLENLDQTIMPTEGPPNNQEQNSDNHGVKSDVNDVERSLKGVKYEPLRKRRREKVDYKELYEKMKKESVSA